ncbi:hypothetical protein ABR737_00710 [Streptomyces sp. Edi2]|uniref:hypothetical protein n=1 Tax=Streptomyces sp. Edi2 TaxID=3162528 RepID=UPI0033067CBC
MPDEADEAAETDEVAASKKAVIQPARPWPVYNVDRAKAELIAMELLTQGLSQYRVRIMTKLSAKNIRRLAGIVAEDAKNPPLPRIAGRTPAHRASIRPAGRVADRAPARKRTTHPPTRSAADRSTQTSPAQAPTEPEQMAFSLA